MIESNFRYFKGSETEQADGHTGVIAEADSWYFEPLDYQGDVLWSEPYGSLEAAVMAASGSKGGAKGGASKSFAKKSAAAANGKKGGRPRKFWLVEGGEARPLQDQNEIDQISNQCNWRDQALAFAATETAALKLAASYDAGKIQQDNQATAWGTVVVCLS